MDELMKSPRKYRLKKKARGPWTVALSIQVSSWIISHYYKCVTSMAIYPFLRENAQKINIHQGFLSPWLSARIAGIQEQVCVYV
jgi:hypothetical protein